ncbi:NADH-quinone oxidoreductase subunit NuoB [Tepidibacillus marianensis]|uniref:NADH-quinone oxidoreductase subunit B family protein n=1 Tax=Tepidibacillus marianensis TaxID=3131995 RepID=UPI0030D1D301
MECKEESRTEHLSLHLRHLDSGSCNGCDFELGQLSSPIYDLQHYGIAFVASPRHADAVVVTGNVTHNLQEAVMKTYEAVPEPKWVIAVGDCACGKGILGKTYASHTSVNDVLPVDIEIPGCPPSPEEIIKTIVKKYMKLKVKVW